MRIGVTYDLRSDYKAMGYSEEETAEFDWAIEFLQVCRIPGQKPVSSDDHGARKVQSPDR